jgi:predicted dehydrogenase
MSSSANRRDFLRIAAGSSVGWWVAGGVRAEESRSPNERIAMASIGVDGKGRSDSADAGQHGDMVAICDVDENRLNKAGESRFPQAKRYTDFRKMLDEMGKRIDAVTVSTADHNHAPASLMAMRMGKHCFCQKPLTRTIYEARLMATVAQEMKVATQMGNQGSADSGLRQAAAWLRAGVLGTVKEVHIWTNRPIWPQGVDRPASAPCPGWLNWDAWLGPAPERPYGEGYHPFAWRGFWDFGTGALGDMGCHEVNMVFRGLDLRNPISVSAETSGHNKDSLPAWSIITYEFAATPARPGLKMVWYDGGKKPPAELLEGIDSPQARVRKNKKKQAESPGDGLPQEGKLVIGDKGRLWGYQQLLDGAQPVPVTYPQSPGHFEEWVNAIRGGAPALSNFVEYAAPLTELVLLGNLSAWCGEKIQWDADKMQVTNVTGLERLIKPEYRSGYTLDA